MVIYSHGVGVGSQMGSVEYCCPSFDLIGVMEGVLNPCKTFKEFNTLKRFFLFLICLSTSFFFLFMFSSLLLSSISSGFMGRC